MCNANRTCFEHTGRRGTRRETATANNGRRKNQLTRTAAVRARSDAAATVGGGNVCYGRVDAPAGPWFAGVRSGGNRGSRGTWHASAICRPLPPRPIYAYLAGSCPRLLTDSVGRGIKSRFFFLLSSRTEYKHDRNDRKINFRTIFVSFFSHIILVARHPRITVGCKKKNHKKMYTPFTIRNLYGFFFCPLSPRESGPRRREQNGILVLVFYNTHVRGVPYTTRPRNGTARDNTQ